MAQLASKGGDPVVKDAPESLFHWPIVTDEDLSAVNDVLRSGTMSGTDVTKAFEQEYALWNGVEYALGCCNGTAALNAAFWACGVGAGDEVIAPALTYWASCAAILHLGGTVCFADVEPDTLCLDPDDFERKITDRTRAVVVVNYGGMPADYDRILPIARKHGIKVIEDNSHAHGAMYKGKMCGSFGDIAGASMMAGKSFAIGEAGMITTNDRMLYERCISFGHYERTGLASRFNPADAQVHQKDLLPFAGLPLGGVKHRMNQTCAAMGRVQLKHYPDRIAAIQKAMNYFCDGIDRIPGIEAIRPKWENSDKGGWYFALAHFDPEVVGCSGRAFCDALIAEGVTAVHPGANKPLHTHNFFHQADVFHQGLPTALAFGQRDVRIQSGTLPVTERVATHAIGLPWFKHVDKVWIDRYIDAFRKVAEHASELQQSNKERS